METDAGIIGARCWAVKAKEGEKCRVLLRKISRDCHVSVADYRFSFFFFPFNLKISLFGYIQHAHQPTKCIESS